MKGELIIIENTALYKMGYRVRLGLIKPTVEYFCTENNYFFL